MGMLCLDCDKLIKLQTKQMIELGIKRNLANETKQHMKRKSIKKSYACGIARKVP
jgi:hypothetical protein